MLKLHTYVESGTKLITEAMRRAVANSMAEVADEFAEQLTGPGCAERHKLFSTNLLGDFAAYLDGRDYLLDRAPDPGPIHTELKAPPSYWRCAYCGQPRPLDRLQCVSCGAGRPE